MSNFLRSSVTLALLVSIVTPSDAQRPTTPETARALLTALAHDSLQGRATGTIGAMKAARLIAAQMRRVGLEPVGDSAFYQRVGSVTTGEAVNVIGVLRGADPALSAEYIVVGAHYDHLGTNAARAVNGDSIFNGADDDASGVIAMLETARQLSTGPRPKRSVIFVAFTGEERGMTGTRWYLDHPVRPLDATVADVQIEMIGRPDSLAGGPGKLWLTGYERSTMGEQLAGAGLPVIQDPRPAMSFFTRSDNYPFALRGIPAHTLSSFGGHTDYHRPSDEVGTIDFAHYATAINTVARAVRVVADGPRPTWKENGRPQPAPPRP